MAGAPGRAAAEELVRAIGSAAEVFDLDEGGALRRLAANGAAEPLAVPTEPSGALLTAVAGCLRTGGADEVRMRRAGSGSAHALRHGLAPLTDGDGRRWAVLGLVGAGPPLRAPRGERVRALLELTSDDIWECDAELRLIRVHGKGVDKRRIAPLIGCGPHDLLDPEAPPEDFSRMMAAMEAHRPFRNHVFPLRTPGGERFWMRFSGFPLFDGDGAFAGYLGTSTSITEERQRLAAERRRQQLESLGQLAGGVAHEFNNLLVPITMLSKMALGRIGDDETLRLFLTTIHENGWKAAQIVRSVLTYARQLTPTAGPVACGEVVAERVQLLRQALPPSVVFEIEIADTASKILGNAGELSQIVVNLFNNASDAVGGYGTIRCSVVRETLDEVRRAATGLGSAEAVRITVADTGKGIPAEIRDRIFEPFFTTKAIGQGTGLGLSVVDGIVKDWGGHISVDSPPGGGAAFSILLPVVEG